MLNRCMTGGLKSLLYICLWYQFKQKVNLWVLYKVLKDESLIWAEMAHPFQKDMLYIYDIPNHRDASIEKLKKLRDNRTQDNNSDTLGPSYDGYEKAFLATVSKSNNHIQLCFLPMSVT